MTDAHAVTTAPRDHRGPTRSAVRSVGPVLLAAVPAAVAAVLLDWRLLVPLGVGIPLALVGVLDATATPSRDWPLRTTPSLSGRLHRVGTLAWIWVAILFGTRLQLLSGRRSLEAAASGSVSLDNLVELAAISMAGLVVATAVRRGGWAPRVPRLTYLFGGYALLAAASVTWSRLPLFSMARAYEFVILALFTAYCAARAATEVGFAEELLERILRPAIAIILLLSFWALAQGGFSLDRFTWPGIDPVYADHPFRPRGHAAMLAFPVVALLLHPRRRRITRPIPWWLVVVALLPLIHQTGSRSYTIALVAAVLVGWLVSSLRDSRVGAVGLSGMLTVGAMVLLTAAEPVMEFIYRNQDPQAVTGLNGRLELWRQVLADPLGNQVWGIGVGAVRGGLPGEWDPPNTHNAWIETLQTLGVLGLILLGAFVLAVLATALLRRQVAAAWMVTYVTVASQTSVTISEPSFTLTLLCLAAALVCATERTGDPPEVPLPEADVPRAGRRTPAVTGPPP